MFFLRILFLVFEFGFIPGLYFLNIFNIFPLFYYILFYIQIGGMDYLEFLFPNNFNHIN